VALNGPMLMEPRPENSILITAAAPAAQHNMVSQLIFSPPTLYICKKKQKP